MYQTLLVQRAHYQSRFFCVPVCGGCLVWSSLVDVSATNLQALLPLKSLALMMYDRASDPAIRLCIRNVNRDFRAAGLPQGRLVETTLQAASYYPDTMLLGKKTRSFGTVSFYSSTGLYCKGLYSDILGP